MYYVYSYFQIISLFCWLWFASWRGIFRSILEPMFYNLSDFVFKIRRGFAVQQNVFSLDADPRFCEDILWRTIFGAIFHCWSFHSADQEKLEFFSDKLRYNKCAIIKLFSPPRQAIVMSANHNCLQSTFPSILLSPKSVRRRFLSVCDSVPLAPLCFFNVSPFKIPFTL
jgi:hypothetical protein